MSQKPPLSLVVSRPGSNLYFISGPFLSPIILSFKSYPTVLKMRFLSSKSPSSPDTITPQTSDLEAHSKAATAHTELTNISTLPKWHLSSKAADGDTALALFSNPDELHEEISAEDEARLQRKIDFMILPYLAVCDAFFYIDKTTLSYAAIFGIQDDLKLVGTQYSK